MKSLGFIAIALLAVVTLFVSPAAHAQGNRVRFWIDCDPNGNARIYVYADPYSWPYPQPGQSNFGVWLSSEPTGLGEGPMQPGDIQPKYVAPHDRGLDSVNYRLTVRFPDGYQETQYLYYRYPSGCFPTSNQPQPPPPPPPPPTPQPFNQLWRGQYFANPTLTSPPSCVRDETVVIFNWGESGPGCGIPGQYFSARWDSTQFIPATGLYSVNLTVDDGARVYLDDALILDAWREQSPTAYSTTVSLNAGPHAWRVVYFQAGGGAQINFQIVPYAAPPPPPPPPPPTAPPPVADVIVDSFGAGWRSGGNLSAWRQSPNGNGGSALWTINHSFIPPVYNWGIWTPTLPQARNYEVFAYIPGGIATTRNARYWVVHAGRYTLVPRIQAAYDDQWVSLGTYYFAARGNEYISLSDVTLECNQCTTIVWDAVKFSPR